MPLSRRRLLGLSAALGLTAACAPAAPAATPPSAGPPPPLDGPDALVDWIAAQPDRASLLVDDGRGTVIEHLADRPRPVASANKVVHLVAYAQAVASGRLDPDGPVPVAAWDSWYVPALGTDTHPAALQALGATPQGTVTWDGIAAVMIDLSDNAAADLLRAELGDDALVAAAAATGWSPVELPCFAGEQLVFDAVPPGADRRVAALEAGRAYAADPARRAAFAATLREAAAAVPSADPTAGLDEATQRNVLRWWDGSPVATVRQLAGVHRAAATDALGPEVSSTVRRHLERGLAGLLPDGVVGAGQKGGDYAGLSTNAVTFRRADGTLGVSVLSLSGMDWQPYQEAAASVAPLVLSQQVLLDAGLRDRLRAAVGGS
ncbi:serine hydrolase [Pseudonocardia humida]|uniref:Beta-lactamase n=1 Tax=Pseudonocardia humida TaxID=2800819 RepID=A0ABT1A2R4_9PSEU|nr:serine hydrolase [Pseudonocardia humida]MCO1657094.1 serine hydrolase [Pseudonocardia humida]